MIFKILVSFLLLLSSISLCATDSAARLVNGSAAIVNKKVITVRDAYVYRTLNRLKSGLTPIIFEETGENLRKTVQKLVFEEMVLAEMKSLQKDINVDGLVRGWTKNIKKDDLNLIKRTYSVDESEIAEKVGKTFKADKFVQLKIETVTPVVTEDEAMKYFKRNEAQFRGRSYEGIRPNIVLLLKKEAVQKNLEEWIKGLKDKYEASILLETN